MLAGGFGAALPLDRENLAALERFGRRKESCCYVVVMLFLVPSRSFALPTPFAMILTLLCHCWCIQRIFSVGLFCLLHNFLHF